MGLPPCPNYLTQYLFGLSRISTKHYSLELHHNTQHKFIDILVSAFIGSLCGCDDWVEVEEFCNRKKRMFEGVLE